MLISLLIPVYGVEKYIERCAVSLFEQTLLDHIEYIFVNDCTKDRSMEILQSVMERYPFRKKQITILHHATNRGLAASRQTALDSAHGDYVLTVDSDDWLELDACELLLQKASDTCFDILVFDYYVNYDKRYSICQQRIVPTGKGCLELLFLGHIHGGTCLKLIKRELYNKYGIKYIEGLNMLEDISVMFRLLYFAERVEKLDMPLYHYYQSNASSYTFRISQSSQNNMLQLLVFMDSFFAKHKLSAELLEAFEAFRQRIYLLLLQSAENYHNYLRYVPLMKEMSSMNNRLLLMTDRVLFFCVVHSIPFVSYGLLYMFRGIKKIKYVIKNI